jgi:acetyl-CoA carboxylase carboxyl transferase subunit alpha
MSRLTVPILSVVIGEGGSGGALALGVADRILMLEHSVYSVISPEGCAAILWDNPEKIPDAASSLKMTADDLAELGVIDQIVSEPLGGAHREPRAVYDQVGKALTNQLFELLDVHQAGQLIMQRDQKYRKIGAVTGLLS